MKHTSVLVTGAEGLIGSHIVRALTDTGSYRVIALSRRRAKPEFSEVDWRNTDLCQPSSVAALADTSATVIVHAAAMLPRTLDDARAAEANRLIDTHVLRLVHKTRASLIYLSSQSVYEHESIPWHEAQLVAPTSPYAAGKYRTERAVREVLASSASLRISSPYSASDTTRPGVLFHFVREAMAGRPLMVMGDGQRTQDFVHAADVARAVIAVLRNWQMQPIPIRHDVFNIASGTAVSMSELAKLVSSFCNSVRVEHVGTDIHGDRRTKMSILHAEKTLIWRPQIDLRMGVAQLFRRLRGANEDWFAV